MSSHTRPAGVATQALGLGLMAGAMLLMTVVAVLVFPEEAGGAAIAAALLAGGATLVWRAPRTWAKVVGLIVTLAAATMFFFLAFGIFQVFSPLEFVAGLAFVLGFLLAMIGGIRALTTGRKRTGPTTGETRLRTLALGLMGVAVVISVGGFFLTKEDVSDADAAGATPLAMANFEFDPGTVSVASGGKLVVTNEDTFTHDFKLEAYDILVPIGPGSSALVDLSQVPTGTYTYVCSLHSSGEEGMVGILEVTA